MGEKFYMLFWFGVFFLIIGLWMWRKDRKQLHTMIDKMTDKENNLYELYQALEDLMIEMDLLYGSQDPIVKIQEEKQSIEKETPNDENQVGADNKELENIAEGKYHRVIHLKDQGYTEEEIARDLEMGIGEVRLILEFKGG